jgi:hypothetical protein
MKASERWRRRLARQVTQLAAVLLPPRRSAWAAAMRAELAHIDDDAEALHWSLGNLRACLAEQLHALPLKALFSTRAISLLWIVIFITSSVFNLALPLAVRLRRTRIAEVLGSWLKDYHHERLLALADAMPAGLYLAMALVVVAFSITLYLSIRGRASALLAFAISVATSLAVWLYELGMPAYTHALSTPHRWRIGICFLMTAAILTALRRGHRPPQPTDPTGTCT